MPRKTIKSLEARVKELERSEHLAFLGFQDAANNHIKWFLRKDGYAYGVSRLTSPSGGLFYERYNYYTAVRYLDEMRPYRSHGSADSLRLATAVGQALMLQHEAIHQEKQS